MATELPRCGCGHQVRRPEWNPYDGVWECEACGSSSIDEAIPVGPLSADFPFYNQNPDL